MKKITDVIKLHSQTEFEQFRFNVKSIYRRNQTGILLHILSVWRGAASTTNQELSFGPLSVADVITG